MPINILGISAYYHDSASALITDGHIKAAAEEERFTRKKGDSSFPHHAIQYCLESANLDIYDIDYIVFYDDPKLKFDRILETFMVHPARGFRSFLNTVPLWLRNKLDLKKTVSKEIATLSSNDIFELPPLLFTTHHHSHAAAAFYPSPYRKAGVLCIDGVGEWATTSVWLGEDNKLTKQWELRFPHSLGLLYSAFTYYIGFKVNFGEYKLMGLAPYGEPKYKDIILKNLIDLKDDGTFKLNMEYFDYYIDEMINDKFINLFGKPARKPESDLTQHEMDIARSIQEVVEEIVLRLARTIRKELAVEHLCLGGGVALNCVANGKILKENIFEDLWIQPAAGDSGSAIGAAYVIWHEYLNHPRTSSRNDKMQGAYLGPSFANETIKSYLDSQNAVYTEHNDGELTATTAALLAEDNVIGWFQGRMEFGPRALGNRSILGDPRNLTTQSKMNLKIKFRESFRPFAPVVLAEYTADYFELKKQSPYMLLVAPIANKQRKALNDQENNAVGLDKLRVCRSEIPAVTHVDYSARVQTMEQEVNPLFHQLLTEFHKKTTCPVLVNTSFNVRGEPIVCTPKDAYECFLRTNMDYLVLGNFILNRNNQPANNIAKSREITYAMD